MKELNKKLIISYLSNTLLGFIVFIVCALLENIILGLLIFIVVIISSNMISSRIKKYNENKKINIFKTKIKDLKNKENKNLLEILYLNAYNDLAIDILVRVLKDNNIKHIYDIDFDIDENSLNSYFTYKYKSYVIENEIYEDKMISKMELQKDKELQVNICDYNNLEEYFNAIIPSINERISLIDKNKENNIENKVINEIYEYQDLNASQLKMTLILSIVTTPMFGVLTYFGIKESITIFDENIVNFIIFCIIISLLPGLIIFSYFHCILGLIKNKKLKKDIINNNISKLSGKPDKVRLITSTIGMRYPNVLHFGSGFVLYFKKKKLKYIVNYSLPNRKQRKEIIKEILKSEFELTYYTNSNYICSNLKEIRKIIRRKTR